MMTDEDILLVIFRMNTKETFYIGIDYINVFQMMLDMLFIHIY
jgi:hypothetical protein